MSRTNENKSAIIASAAPYSPTIPPPQRTTRCCFEKCETSMKRNYNSTFLQCLSLSVQLFGVEVKNVLSSPNLANMIDEGDPKRIKTLLRAIKRELEKDKKEMTDEYVNLKAIHHAQAKEIQRIRDNNKRLSIELWNVANNRAAISREYYASLNEGAIEQDKINQELKRVKILIEELTDKKVAPSELSGNEAERLRYESLVWSNQRRYQDELKIVKEANESELEKLNRIVKQLRIDLSESQRVTREKQHQLSVLNAQLITIRSDRDNLNLQHNRLQHKLKDLNDEYHQRLSKYVKDVAEYMDKGAGVPFSRDKVGAELRRHVKSMLNEIQRSHQQREEQLSAAAQQYKKRVNEIARRHEAILIAYRNIRQQVQDRDLTDIDIGPDEAALSLNDAEVASAQGREIARLQDELSRTRLTLEQAKVQGLIPADEDELLASSAEHVPHNWTQLQRQLKEFTVTTQHDLEKERAGLLAKNSLLEEQMREAQDYIDSHLVKYKNEIVRLRRLLGWSETDQSADFTRISLLPPK